MDSTSIRIRIHLNPSVPYTMFSSNNLLHLHGCQIDLMLYISTWTSLNRLCRFYRLMIFRNIMNLHYTTARSTVSTIRLLLLANITFYTLISTFFATVRIVSRILSSFSGLAAEVHLSR